MTKRFKYIATLLLCVFALGITTAQAKSKNVIIGLSSSNTAEDPLAPSSVTLTSDNRNTAQTVMLTGVDDAVVDGDMASTIVTAPANSGDANYNALNPANVSASNTENNVEPVLIG